MGYMVGRSASTSPRDFGAVGDGIADDSAAILAASLAALSNSGTMYFQPGIYATYESLTVPAGVAVHFGVGAVIEPKNGVTVTILGPVLALDNQIFSPTNGSVTCQYGVNARWWGALGDGQNDDTLAIQAAIDCIPLSGGVVRLPAGTYVISSPLQINAPINLIGDGIASTRIYYSPSANGFSIFPAADVVVKLSGLHLTPSASATAGSAIATGNTCTLYLSDVFVDNSQGAPQVGMMFEHAGNVYLERTQVSNAIASGYIISNNALEVYADKAGANGTSNGPNWLIEATSGMHMTDLDQGGGQTGTKFAPGEGQVIQQGCFYENCGLGDTTETFCLEFSPSGNGVIEGVYFNNCRVASSKTSVGVYVAGGTGIQFVNFKSVNHSSHGFALAGGSVLDLQDCWVGGNGGEGVALEGSSSVRIAGGRYGPCDGLGGNAGAGVLITSSSGNSIVIDDIDATGNSAGSVVNQATLSDLTIRNVKGYNPVGLLTAPAVPASGTAIANNFGVTAHVYIAGGTVTGVFINNQSTGILSGQVTLAPGEEITLTYTSAPTWTWFGD